MTAVNTLSTTLTPSTTTVVHIGPAVGTHSVSLTPTFPAVNQSAEVWALISAANALREIYNAHIANADVHVNADTANSVSGPNATDLASAMAILNSLKTAFNAHRVEETVHGNVVRILISAPEGLKYHDIKFFISSTGTPDLVSSFSDDETQSQIPVLAGP